VYFFGFMWHISQQLKRLKEKAVAAELDDEDDGVDRMNAHDSDDKSSEGPDDHGARDMEAEAEKQQRPDGKGAASDASDAPCPPSQYFTLQDTMVAGLMLAQRHMAYARSKRARHQSRRI
jgi:hypothetical protein